MLSYEKHHLLPPFESNLTPGTSLTLLHKPSATWGVAICKDMDFTGLSRQYGKAGAGLMLVPGWDFNLDRAWHGHNRYRQLQHTISADDRGESWRRGNRHAHCRRLLHFRDGGASDGHSQCRLQLLQLDR